MMQCLDLTRKRSSLGKQFSTEHSQQHFIHLFPPIILSFNTHFLKFRTCNYCGPTEDHTGFFLEGSYTLFNLLFYQRQKV